MKLIKLDTNLWMAVAKYKGHPHYHSTKLFGETRKEVFLAMCEELRELGVLK